MRSYRSLLGREEAYKLYFLRSSVVLWADILYRPGMHIFCGRLSRFHTTMCPRAVQSCRQTSCAEYLCSCSVFADPWKGLSSVLPFSSHSPCIRKAPKVSLQVLACLSISFPVDQRSWTSMLILNHCACSASSHLCSFTPGKLNWVAPAGGAI